MTIVPAWADAFLPGRLREASPLPGRQRITREDAYGDGRGTGVKVAIVDSGIDAEHPDVRGVAGGAVPEADRDAPDGVRIVEGPHDDVFGHGTACAGIVRELAPGVELYSVRVLGRRLTGRAYVFARGLEWCLEHGIQVVNLSLSTSNESWYAGFHEICDDAAHAGVVLVSALNNQRGASYPSEFSSVLSVAATIGEDREVFSRNPDPPAEWGAPGIDVVVAQPGGRHMRTTGNSFAAPVIAGHCARILGANPGLAPFQVKAVLAELADNAASSAPPAPPA
ncbi:MAG: S8 family serine peptidase [Acidimicrobiales bacterium]